MRSVRWLWSTEPEVGVWTQTFASRICAQFRPRAHSNKKQRRCRAKVGKPLWHSLNLRLNAAPEVARRKQLLDSLCSLVRVALWVWANLFQWREDWGNMRALGVGSAGRELRARGRHCTIGRDDVSDAQRTAKWQQPAEDNLSGRNVALLLTIVVHTSSAAPAYWLTGFGWSRPLASCCCCRSPEAGGRRTSNSNRDNNLLFPSSSLQVRAVTVLGRCLSKVCWRQLHHGTGVCAPVAELSPLRLHTDCSFSAPISDSSRSHHKEIQFFSLANNVDLQGRKANR